MPKKRILTTCRPGTGSGTPRHLPPGAVPGARSARSRALVALVAEPEEEVEGGYSHQTALSLYELSDLNPAKLHMTVPTQPLRRSSDIPGIVVLHYRDLLKSEIQAGPGYKYTRPRRTILDLIEVGTLKCTFIRQALRQAVDRGLITRQQLRNTQLGESGTQDD